VKGNGGPVGRRGQDEDVRHFPQAHGVVVVELDENSIGVLQVGRRGTDGGREIHAAVGSDFVGLDHGEIQLSVKSAEHRLGEVRQVHVHVFHFLSIDLRAQSRTALVGGPVGHGIRLGQGFIDTGPARGSRQHPDLKRLAQVVKVPGMLGEGPGDHLGGARIGESAEGDRCTVKDVGCSFLGGKNRKRHSCAPGLWDGRSIGRPVYAARLNGTPVLEVPHRPKA